MGKLSQERLQGIVRHTLTFLGGILVWKGALSEDALNEFLAIAVTFSGILWSLFSKN